MSTVKTICQPLPALGGALKTVAQKKREKKEETKVPAAEKKPQKAIVDLSGKTTPANLFKKQVQPAKQPLAEKKVEVIADCLALVQDQGLVPTKTQDAKAEVEKEAVAKDLRETKAARELEEKEKAEAVEKARLGKLLFN